MVTFAPRAGHEVLTELPGDPASGMLLLADHASNRVPGDIALGLPPAMMTEHVAIDIGVDPLARALCARLDCPGVLAAVSRLVIDLNREEDAPGLIPAASDGHPVPGNRGLDAAARAARIARFWRPYHDHVSNRIAADRPKLLTASRRGWRARRSSRGRGRSASSTISTSARRGSRSRCWARRASSPATTCLIPGARSTPR